MAVFDSLFTALIFVTVVLTAFGVGSATSRQMVRHVVQSPAFFVVVAINAVVVPTIGVLVVQALPLTPPTATGLTLCAICAAGPLGLKVSQLSRSDVVWALSLTVTLLSLNVVTLPVWSAVVLDRALAITPAELVAVLAGAILVPAAAGMWWWTRDVHRATQWSSIAARWSNATFVAAVIVGTIANIDGLRSSLSSWALLVGVGAIILAAGLCGGLDRSALARRRASVLITLNRATSVALLVISRAFPDDPEIFTTAAVFGLAQTFAAAALGLYWRRSPLTPLTRPPSAADTDASSPSRRAGGSGPEIAPPDDQISSPTDTTEAAS